MSIIKNMVKAVVIVVCFGLLALMLLWLVVSTGSQSADNSDSVSASIMNKFNMYVNNAASEALDGIIPIKKVYTLSEDLVIAPEPDQSRFGKTSDPAEIDSIVQSASGLLGDQETVWTSDVQLFSGSEVNYYLDDTIMVITWKEVLHDAVYTFSEVKIADPSQIRRYLANNSYGSSIQYLPSDMATTVNAVVAISGDFYKFRDMGIVVYQREVHRVEGEEVDTCFIDSNGDFNFVYRGEMLDKASAEAYVEENDILFSLAFGPVLIDDGKAVYPSHYPIGEINLTYSRSAIAQMGELHYLLVTVNYEGGHMGAATIDQLADTLMSRGCDKAYTLDGGQTATIIMNDRVINRVDFGYQRNISDILYFATAIPDREGDIE